MDGSSMSGMSREAATMGRRRHRMKQRITGWLSAYSGCTKGHGERLMKKIYRPRCEDLHVKMNSGVQELLMTSPPCFCSLQAVNFRNFLLGNRGVQALWPLLKYARALKSLNLAGNDIHDTGMLHIFSVLMADAQNQAKDDVSGLLVVDLSRNPITGSIYEDIHHFNESRKDVLLLGFADTMMPLAKRQRILRQVLTKFAAVEAHVMLEAWRLAKDPLNFVDRDVFVQAERIVEAAHGSGIHDIVEISDGNNRRHQGWHDDDETWSEEDRFSPRHSDADTHLAKDGFLGLDDVPSPGRLEPGLGEDGFPRYCSQDDDDLTEGGARDTPLSPLSSMVTPTPPPLRNPFAPLTDLDVKRPGSSWAARRRTANTRISSRLPPRSASAMA